MAKIVSVIYSEMALKDLKQLDKVVARRIVLKIKDNADQPDPLLRAKFLSGKLAGWYRYRIGDYRAIFSLDSNGHIVLLKVLKITHRKDVYRI
jgi:mRNA interferase RelE/StbE